MFCYNCGQQLPDEANFCMKCGKATLKDISAGSHEANSHQETAVTIQTPTLHTSTSESLPAQESYAEAIAEGQLTPISHELPARKTDAIEIPLNRSTQDSYT